jgi:CheY-specific phosphatase CheX
MSSNQDLIAEVAQSVLETMVFACSERSESFPAQRSEDYLLAEITFSGSRNGQLLIMAPKPLCCEWAEMMTGDDSADVVYDVLGEVTNVIGGNWITRSFTTEEKIKLNPPNVFLADAHDWERVNRELATVVLSVEDNPFILHFNTTD